MALFGFKKKKNQENELSNQEEMNRESSTNAASTEDVGENLVWNANGTDGNEADEKTTSTCDFKFEIYDALEMEDGCMLLGIVTEGEITPESKVDYVDENNNKLFECKIEGIEQNKIRLKKASVCHFGYIGPIYSLKIAGFAASAFEEGHFLVKTAAPCAEVVEKYNHIRLSDEQRAKVETWLADAEPDMEKAKELEIQELIYGLSYIKIAADHEPRVDKTEEWKAKGPKLFATLEEKLKNVASMFLTIDLNTGFPFYNQGVVDLYSKKEYAELAVEYFGTRYRKLEVREMRVKEDNLYAMLYHLGLEAIMVDNGFYRAAVSRSQLLPPPDFSALPVEQQPVFNPSLRRAVNDFFGEARWTVNYPQREQVLKAKENVMIRELAKGKYIVPMKIDGVQAPSKPGEKVTIPKDAKIMFAAIQNNNGDLFTPLFTDTVEFLKMYPNKDWNMMIMNFKSIAQANKVAGLAVNPAGENVVMKGESLTKVQEVFEQIAKEESEKAAGKMEDSAAKADALSIVKNAEQKGE